MAETGIYKWSYLNQLLTRDPFPGYGNLPQSQNGYNYVNNNPINAVDPTGLIACPIGRWDCDSVNNVFALRKAFLDSASRHNRIPTMDDNGFAALIASTIESERRVGRIDEADPIRNSLFQFLEDLAVDYGCIVSGHYLNKAFREDKDYAQFWRYFTNCIIWCMPITDSGACRSMILVHADH